MPGESTICVYVFVCITKCVHVFVCVNACVLEREKRNLSPKQNTRLDWN